VPRRPPGALIKVEADVLARVPRVLDDRSVATIEGETLKIEVNAILVRDDTPGAVALARSIRSLIEASGAELAPLSAH